MKTFDITVITIIIFHEIVKEKKKRKKNVNNLKTIQLIQQGVRKISKKKKLYN